MTYPFIPSGFLGRPLRLVSEADGGPLKGNDVIALQEACDLLERDGVFGKQTDQALRILQSRLGIAIDGVAGPATDRSYCLRRVSLHDDGTPPGLARGIIEGESGYRLGAQSPTYVRNNETHADVGAVQFSCAQSDEARILRSLNADQGIAILCQHLRDKRTEYFDAAFVKQHDQRTRIAGWLACGSWNAPAWTDVWSKKGPDDPYLQVKVTLQDGTTGTREQWIRNYVSTKIAYVSTWQV